MRVTNILLVRTVNTNSDNTLDISGYFNHITLRKPPFSLRGTRILWMLELEQGDISPTQEVRMVAPSGRLSVRIQATPQDPAPQKKPFTPSHFTFGLERVKLTEYGLYRIEVFASSADGKSSEHRIGLMVHRPSRDDELDGLAVKQHEADLTLNLT